MPYSIDDCINCASYASYVFEVFNCTSVRFERKVVVHKTVFESLAYNLKNSYKKQKKERGCLFFGCVLCSFSEYERADYAYCYDYGDSY